MGDRGTNPGSARTSQRVLVSVLIPLVVTGLLAFAKEITVMFGLLSTSAFMPHRMCLAGLQWLVVSRACADLTIAVAYAIIPMELIRLFRTGFSIQFTDAAKIQHAIYLLPWFAGFIIFCGLTHVMDVITLWWPTYYVDLVVRVCTAIASVGTCFVLHQKIPALIGIVSNADLMLQVRQLSAQQADMSVKLSKFTEAAHRMTADDRGAGV